MERRELIEWVVIIAIILAWWPRIFVGYDPPWYNVLIYWVSPLVLIYILVIRFRRVQAGLEQSEKILDAQHRAAGANVLGYPSVPSGAPGAPGDAERDQDEQ